jgi:prepilin-type N-terminal cleavage/methylation domain-containing protein
MVRFPSPHWRRRVLASSGIQTEKGGSTAMFKHLRDAQARRRGEEAVESGFTLIELLVVIVVLGILAATVVFALSGVTGQSAQAACNSDAKTIEVAVQAYINSPDNATNSAPTSVGDLITAPFQNPNGQADTFLQQAPSNSAYAIVLGGTNGDQVMVTPKGGNQVAYDAQAAGPPATGCYAVS